MNCLRHLLKDQRGYGVFEMLVLVTAAAVIAGSVLLILKPPVLALHNGATEKITNITGSGY